MQDVSSPEAGGRTPTLPASHGPLLMWGLAALVVALSAAIIAGAWIAGSRARGPAAIADLPLVAPFGGPASGEPAVDTAALAAVAAREAEAEAGDAIAQYEIGMVYYGGTLVPADLDRAIEFLRRSAAQDYIPAIMAYADALGSSVAAGTADPGEVFAALDRLIAHPPDDNILGAAHELYGRYLLYALQGPQRDPAGAVDHFVASLAAGNLFAARAIGDAYRSGEGRPVDQVLAYAYYKVAQPLLPDPLGPTIYEIETSLTPAELARAETLTLPALLAQEPDLSH